MSRIFIRSVINPSQTDVDHRHLSMQDHKIRLLLETYIIIRTNGHLNQFNGHPASKTPQVKKSQGQL